MELQSITLFLLGHMMMTAPVIFQVQMGHIILSKLHHIILMKLALKKTPRHMKQAI